MKRTSLPGVRARRRPRRSARAGAERLRPRRAVPERRSRPATGTAATSPSRTRRRTPPRPRSSSRSRAGSISSTSRRCRAGRATVNGQHEENGEMEGGDSVTWKGKLERRGPRRPAVHGRAEERRRVRLHGAPDLLGRQRRRLVRRRGLRHAGGAHRGASAPTSGGGSGSSKTIAIIALVVGALGLARRRRRAALAGGARHEARRAGGRAARRPRGCAGAAGGRRGARVPARDATAGERRALPTADRRSRLTYSERIEPRFAVISVTDATATR